MRTLLTIILLFVTESVSYQQSILNPIIVSYNSEEFVDFWEAYNHVRKWEGNYSNLPFDKGGETYGGITRNFNKGWNGWEDFDKHKQDCVVYWNKHIPELEKWVEDYYYTRWVNDGYDLLNNQAIANYLFDYRNTGIIAYKHVNQILKSKGYKVDVTYNMDNNTINALNNIPSEIFIKDLRRVRKNYYYGVVERNPQLKIYLNGWIKRANDL